MHDEFIKFIGKEEYKKLKKSYGKKRVLRGSGSIEYDGRI